MKNNVLRFILKSDTHKEQVSVSIWGEDLIRKFNRMIMTDNVILYFP